MLKHNQPCVFVVLSVVACGDGARSHEVPWGGDADARVIDGDREVASYTIDPGGCIALEDLQCITPRDECEAAAEVVLNRDGDVIQTICYPKGETLSVAEIEVQAGNVAQNQNDAVIALDSIDDGADIDGNLAVDANNVVIYGDDPATSQIAGDVSVDGNNIIVRGVTIQGDVEVLANNAVFLHCVIRGDVIVHGNNSVITACDIFGSVRLVGNNTTLAANHVAGTLEDEGQNSSCDDNRYAEDADGDGAFSDGELGEALTCGT